MNNPISSRRLRLESLEERALLAVTAGFAETAALAAPTGATNWVVNTTADPASWSDTDSVVSLREAIGRSAAGDTITFDESLSGDTVTLNGNQLEVNKAITIDATSIGGITIDADGQSRVFYISGGTADTPVNLVALTITGGYASGYGNDGGGGGIFNKGILTLTNCTVAENSVNGDDGGGGGVCNEGVLALTGCTVTGNSVNGVICHGGGIDNGNRLTMSNCTVSGNTSDYYGGGICNGINALATLIDCTVAKNVSSTGGGIYNDGTLEQINCIVWKNNASGGGGIDNGYHGKLTLRNCTVSGNTADNGSGLWSNGLSYVYNTIIAQNWHGPDVYESGHIYAYNTLSSYTEWGTKANCLVYDPFLPLFADGTNGDYSLAAGSPAINGGHNLYISGYTTDIVGNPRIYGGKVDIGAYECQTVIDVFETPSTVVTTKDDVFDFTDNLISLREAIAYANEGDTITFDALLAGQPINLELGELTIDKAVSIDASSIGGIVLDAKDNSRVFNISGGTANTPVKLIALTVTGGYAVGKGGGIYSAGKLSLVNCAVVRNSSLYTSNGGGIYNDGGVLTLTNCAVVWNTHTGIYNYAGTVALTNCTVARNSTGISSGYNGSAVLNLFNTIVAQNDTDIYQDSSNPGEINAYNTLSSYTDWTSISNPLIYDPALPLFVDVVTGNFKLSPSSQAIDKGINNYIRDYSIDLAGNSRIHDGIVDLGAYEYQWDVSDFEAPSTVVTTCLDFVDPTDNLISLREAIQSYADDGDTITFDASLAGQTITLDGSELEIKSSISIDASSIGGVTIDAKGKSRVFNVSGGTVELIGLTITGGKVYDSGGGIHNSAELTLINCAVVGNSASGNYTDGGGIYNKGKLTLTNCTVAGNTAKKGGGIYAYDTVNLYNTIVAQNTASGSGNDIGIYSGDVYAYNTLSSFTDWTDYSKCWTYISYLPLFTNAVDGDYTLAENSQAIDKGNNFYVTIDTDLAGNQRKVNGIVDIGAYEYQEEGGNETFETPSTVVTTNLDVVDYTDKLISLREAISYAAIADTITFDALLGGQPIILELGELAIDKAVSIDASSIGGITIDANSKSRVFAISSGTADTPVNLVALTITNGSTGIYNAGSLYLTNCTVTGNNGTGVYNTNFMRLSDCFVSENEGRGVYNGGKGETQMTNCTVSGNAGSGVYNSVTGKSHGVVTMTNCTIVGNSAVQGGGIYNCGQWGVSPVQLAEMMLVNCIVAENTAKNEGGGIENQGKLTLVNCAITNNTAEYGGGIDNHWEFAFQSPTAELNLAKCIVSGNSAFSGGGIYNEYGNINLDTCAVIQNAADFVGGIVSEESGTTKLRYCTVAGNTASGSNGGVYISKASEGYTIRTDESLICNLIVQNTGSSGFGNDLFICGNGETEEVGNLVGDLAIDYRQYQLEPYDPSWTFTRAFFGYDPSLPLFTDPANGDYTLAENSQAIDATRGTCEIWETDLAGNRRFTYKYIDVGAYEYQPPSLEPVSTIVTTKDDVVDFTDNLISLREAISYAAIGDTITFDASLGGQTIILKLGELAIDKTVTVDASTVGGIVLDANGNSRVFNISGGTANTPIKLIALKVTGGYVSGNGGGINNTGGLSLVNCTVAENSVSDSYSGGGIYNGGTLTLTNCTVTGNSATSGGGIYQSGQFATGNICNTILVQNTENDLARSDGGSLNGYNTLWSSSSPSAWTSSTACLKYNVSLQLFTDAANGDYTLVKNPQTVNKGNNEYISGYETDLAGNPRIAGGTVDLGAYEFGSSAPIRPLAAPSIATGSNRVYVSYGANRHLIQWSAVANASGYELAYSADGNSWTTISASETAAVITGLTYGAAMRYRVRALGTGSYTDSDWSAVKTFSVCPMDINGDGDISGGDRTLLGNSWLSEEGEDEFRYYCDISGDGDIGGADRAYLSNNWLLNVEDDADDLQYPPSRASDAVFAEFASADLAADLEIF